MKTRKIVSFCIFTLLISMFFFTTYANSNEKISTCTTKSIIYQKPAANTYKVIEKAVQKYCRVLSTYDIYIGLGYGGVFFSIVAAMLMNKKVVILDMKKEKDKLDINCSKYVS